MKMTTAGIDLAKNVFQAHGVDAQGKAVLRKELDRSKVTGESHGTVSADYASATNAVPISTRHSSRLPAYSSAGDTLSGFARRSKATNLHQDLETESSRCKILGSIPNDSINVSLSIIRWIET